MLPLTIEYPSMISVKGWIEHLEGMSEKDIVLTINDHKMDNEKKSMICGVYIFLRHKSKTDKSFHNAVSDINGFIASLGNEVDALLAHKYYVQCVRIKLITAYKDSLGIGHKMMSSHTEIDETLIDSYHAASIRIPFFYICILLQMVDDLGATDKARELLGDM